jgi:hypothetical protein
MHLIGRVKAQRFFNRRMPSGIVKSCRKIVDHGMRNKVRH